MSLLTAALAGAPTGAQRLNIAASSALAASLAGGIQAAARSLADGGSGLQASLSSPPRPAAAAGYLRGSVAPSYCLAGTKTCRRRGRRPDNEPGTGGGDGTGGGIGGGGNWFGPWDEEDFEDEEGESGGVISAADAFLWRMGCLLVALQAMHWVLLQGQAVQRRCARVPSAGFATLSQAFFTRRSVGFRPLPQPPQTLQLLPVQA